MNGKVKQYTGNGFEVPAMILLQAYLCTYSLLRGVTFEVLPLSNYSFSPMMLPLLEIFFWNSCCGIVFSAFITYFFLDFFSILKSSSCSGRLYFWKQPEVIQTQIRNRVGVPFQQSIFGPETA
jgi:hypothetical protein